jgi:4-hydroxybutyrate CoA-transferase
VSWRDEYEARRADAAEALSLVKSGDRVVLGHAAGEPTPLVEELVAQHARLRDVEIVHMVALGAAEYCRPEMAPHFRHNAVFAGKNTQAAIACRGCFARGSCRWTWPWCSSPRRTTRAS